MPVHIKMHEIRLAHRLDERGRIFGKRDAEIVRAGLDGETET